MMSHRKFLLGVDVFVGVVCCEVDVVFRHGRETKCLTERVGFFSLTLGCSKQTCDGQDKVTLDKLFSEGLFL